MHLFWIVTPSLSAIDNDLQVSCLHISEMKIHQEDES